MEPGPQFRNLVHEEGPSTPLEGTERHPQGRLFAPTGMHHGDPWAMAPERWVAGEAATGTRDVMAWHSSSSPQLPRYDDPTAFDRPRQEFETDEGDIEQAEDPQGRPLMVYGSGVGMHFGTMGAAIKRGYEDDRDFIHPVRLPGSTIERTQNRNERTGSRPETGEWSDERANYSPRASRLVEQGKTIPYANAFEDTGSTSYRTMPETARTWSEDVIESAEASRSRFWGEKGMTSPETARIRPHPALEHVARLGYEPVVDTGAIRKQIFNQGERQMTLPGFETPYSEDVYRGREAELKRRVQMPELTMMGNEQADKWHQENPPSDY